MALHTSSGSKQVVVQSAFDHGDDFGPQGSPNHVEAKYMGTTADQKEMHALGRIQQLRVRHTRQGPSAFFLADASRGTFNTYQS